MNDQPTTITDMRSQVRAKKYTWHSGDTRIPGVSLRLSKANLFVPYGQLRAVADALHDAADEYEQAEAEGRLTEVLA